MAEDEAEKLDRELIELLNELRVVLPGVQVMFAFLLTVPFSQRFAQLGGRQRGVFFAAFLATTAASMVLIAPSAYHRVRWRQHDKAQMLKTSNRMAIVGLSLLAVAIASVVFLITDVMFSSVAAGWVTGIASGAIAWLWFGLPLTRAATDDASG